jgi:hypothetical protein
VAKEGVAGRVLASNKWLWQKHLSEPFLDFSENVR